MYEPEPWIADPSPGEDFACQDQQQAEYDVGDKHHVRHEQRVSREQVPGL